MRRALPRTTRALTCATRYDLTSPIVLNKGVVIGVRLGGVVGSIAVLFVITKVASREALFEWLEVITFSCITVCGAFIVFMHGFNENQTADPANLMMV